MTSNDSATWLGVNVSLFRLLLALFSAVVLMSSTSLANPLKDALSKEFKGKSYLVKGFPQDTKLELDNNFQPTKKWHAGSWTLADILVENVNANDHNIEFSGHRVGFLYDVKSEKMIKVKLDDEIDLKIKDVAGMNPDELIDNIKKKALLSDPKDILEALPDSWKPYFAGDFKPGPDGKTHFHAPGLAPISLKDNEVRTVEVAEKMADGEPLYKVSRSDQVEAPKPIHTPDPQFSDIAKKTHTEGIVLLWAIIDRAGNVNRVVVQRPLGLGLDDEAMAAVQKWKFEPARRNGQPVAVQINVEVNFRFTH